MSIDIRHNLVLQYLSEGMSKKDAMIKAGYSEVYAESPQQLTEGKKFQALADKILHNKLLVKRHKQLLNSPKIIRRFVKGDLEIETEEIDSQSISKGLDMAYKLRSLYAPEKHDNRNVNTSVKELVDLLQADESTFKPDGDNDNARAGDSK